eukprot:CAMPEP_0171144782 /NCGR_PEP_ID=MMETSP0766_2-20121228/146520_1 /TAXON_ID=439317 /ORGANISM="Gambierdiscus australes, Strain CAWD 149" /LENGTH=102 /DNA_ID=CAMNT_0011608653 /DNA_START=65 /DNA_END=370 /DNA_ORIENTATION=-
MIEASCLWRAAWLRRSASLRAASASSAPLGPFRPTECDARLRMPSSSRRFNANLRAASICSKLAGQPNACASRSMSSTICAAFSASPSLERFSPNKRSAVCL